MGMRSRKFRAGRLILSVPKFYQVVPVLLVPVLAIFSETSAKLFRRAEAAFALSEQNRA